MSPENQVLNSMERMIFGLRSIYAGYGYVPYKMSKFEEYDLYSRNKDFLISDSVITFTDRNGRLMALKPDVTLSLIKNNTDDPTITKKLYYDENVYRVANGSNSFREIMQSGLECFGMIDSLCIGEVLLIAAKSLQATGRKFVLDVAQFDLLLELVGRITGDGELQDRILKCVGEKNSHGVRAIVSEAGIAPEKAEPLLKLLSLYGNAEQVLPALRALTEECSASGHLTVLEEALSVVEAGGLISGVNLDFSVVSDRNYYNGIIFRGFVEEVPGSVLSGGQYDMLMQKLGRRSSAVGFAVYLDLLERIDEPQKAWDADVLLLTGSGRAAENAALAEKLRAEGKSVRTAAERDPALKFRQVFRTVNGEVELLEDNA